MDVLGLPALAIATIVLTLGFEFVNGFHDSANSIATVVATRVLTPVKAVAWAAMFNFFGIFISDRVARTIGQGIIDQELLWTYGVKLIFCAVVGAIIWDLITWWWGIPTSSSHALIGGLIGAGGAVAAVDAIVWSGTLKTIVFIAVSPMVGFVAGFILIVLVTRMARHYARGTVNLWFRKLQLLSSAFFSLTHGTNDAQKGMGIIMMVIFVSSASAPSEEFSVYTWVMLACGLSIALGTFFGGWRIVKTMASRITKLEPYQGFCAETGGAGVLLVTAIFGIPVSTTHTISGSIMGVGATKRFSAVRWGLGRRIVVAWIVTIPAAATISGLLFLGVLWLG
jgi:PiT family inorganic phosphate transporter